MNKQQNKRFASNEPTHLPRWLCPSQWPNYQNRCWTHCHWLQGIQVWCSLWTWLMKTVWSEQCHCRCLCYYSLDAKWSWTLFWTLCLGFCPAGSHDQEKSAISWCLYWSEIQTMYLCQDKHKLRIKTTWWETRKYVIKNVADAHLEKQWAADITHSLLIRDPPQTCLPFLCRLTCQGQLPAGASSPPTILVSRGVIPHTAEKLWYKLIWR